MSFGELPTPELRQAANEEAALLRVDPATLEGREHFADYVIEDPHIACRQNAVGITIQPDGCRTLRLSVADAGMLVARDSAVAACALRVGYATYDAYDRPLSHMLPPVLSEDRLSLVHGQERPAASFHLPVDPTGRAGELAITRSVVTAQALTLEEAKIRREEEAGNGPLSQLELVARDLFAVRHAGAEIDDTVNPRDEAGNPIDTDYPIELLIIYESLYAINAAVGAYLQRNRAPVILRNYKPDAEDEFWTRNDPEVARLLAKGSFSRIPQGHLGLRLSADQPYAPVTSPLESYADLVNLCNVMALVAAGGEETSASLEKREYPFDQTAISYAVKRLNHLEHEAQEEAAKAAQAEQRRASRSSVKPRSTDYFLKKLADGSAHAGDMAQALFGTVLGDDEKVQRVRRVVVEHVATNIHFANQIIHVAAARGWIDLKPQASPENQADTAMLVVTDTDGNEYTYSALGGPATVGLRAAKLLGTLVGHRVQPVFPEKLTRAYRIANAPFTFLRDLSSRHDLRVGYVVHATDDENSVTITMGLTIHGVRHERTVTAGDVELAEKEGAQAFIDEFGLAKGLPRLPERPERPNRELMADEIRHPITSLNNLTGRLNGSRPEYKFTKSEGKTICTVTFVDEEGWPQTRTAAHKDEQLARKAAAIQVLASLPYLPPDPKRKRKNARYKANVRARGAPTATTPEDTNPMET